MRRSVLRTGVWRGPAVAILTALAVLAGFRMLAQPPASVPPRTFLPVLVPKESPARAWLSGRLTMTDEAASVMAAIADQPVGPTGRTILFFDANGRGVDFYSAQFAAALRRHFDTPSWTAMLQVPRPRQPQTLTTILDGLEDQPVKVVTRNSEVRQRVERYVAAHPEADVVVQLLPPRQPD